jgi:hypothetical protein
MSTNNMTIYSELKARFATFAALRTWLETEEGGRLTVRDTEKGLALIHYDKELSNMAAPHVEHFRSVIWNKETNTPVCAGPSRGRKFGDAPAGGFTAEEFIDGVMINMFWHGDDWQLATRTQIGAHCRYYSTDTHFDELFWATFKDSGLTTDVFDKELCYSWVLQHPKERIVVAPAHGIPRIYLVEVSKSTAGGERRLFDLADVGDALKRFVPARYSLGSLEAVKEHVATWGRRLGHQYQGVVLKHLGNRWKLRTNQYDEARHLRGNCPNRGYRWLELWGEGKLGKYLRIYPEEDAEANIHVGRYKNLTQELHRRYVEIYRDRRYPLGEAPHKFRKLLWELHQAGSGTYFPKVREFMNLQDTARKLWLINYEVRYGADHNPVPVAKRQLKADATGGGAAAIGVDGKADNPDRPTGGAGAAAGSD